MSFPALSQDCFDRAGRHYRVDPDLLRAIAFRESPWRGKAMDIVSLQVHAARISNNILCGLPAHWADIRAYQVPLNIQMNGLGSASPPLISIPCIPKLEGNNRSHTF